MIFTNRAEAGRLLGTELAKESYERPMVLALPRGGVPVAREIADALKTELDVLTVRKIGVPFQPEVAIGAVCEDAKPVWNKELLSQIGLKPADLNEAVRSQRERIEGQVRAFRGGRALPPMKGRTVIIVDDGLATGATTIAAIRYARKEQASRVVIAVPVASGAAARRVIEEGGELVALETPEDFVAVGHWYHDFTQVSDGEVLAILRQTPSPRRPTLVEEIGRRLKPLHGEEDFEALIRTAKDRRVVMLGESSHGTEEFYSMRSLISKRLIRDHGFRFIAVEGDWPDAFRLNEYIRTGRGGSARAVLSQNHRWPTWMWANHEIARLAEWMKGRGAGFYGLDVYSFFESMNEVLAYVREAHPQLYEEVRERYACFDPFERDEITYARSLFTDEEGCRREVVDNLSRLLDARLEELAKDPEALFSARQNARVAKNGEAYYRAMIEGDAKSWNVRDGHMMEVLDALLTRFGEGAKAIVWAHNTHIGDHRATDMKEAGYVNIGGLARERYGAENVFLVGFGTHHGEVLAGAAWGAPEQAMTLPRPPESSIEFHLHEAAIRAGVAQFLLPLDGIAGESPLAERRGHRAVGVVYDPARERRGNYVPTELSRRYDAFIFVDQTSALRSLHAFADESKIPETWPLGQ